MYEMIIRPHAERTLKEVRGKELHRLMEALDELEKKGPDASGVKWLHTIPHGYRKRVGRYRILFTLEPKEKKLSVWIIEIEKDTRKDYSTWIGYILKNL